jgi:arginyl-tRNA synthetase
LIFLDGPFLLLTAPRCYNHTPWKIPMFQAELTSASNQLRHAIESAKLPRPESIQWAPTPFHGEWGYGTAVCFQIAAIEARSDVKIKVPERAHQIAERLVQELIASELGTFVAVRGYINVIIPPAHFAQRVIDTILDQADRYGAGDTKSDRVMVEYAQPNTHHSFHIGHARNALLGESLSRIVEFAGYPTIRASYPGDIGLGVITCLWGYLKFYKGQEPEGIHERGQWLAKIYTEANRLLSSNDTETEEEVSQRIAYDNERRELLKRWDQGDPEILQLWRETRQWSLDELDAILSLLGIKIDVYFFESEVDEPAKEIVEELIQLGIAEDGRPEEPVVIHIDEKLGLEKEKYRTVVILRSDGTTLYLTKDLALAKEKIETYHIDRSVYVVDVRQSLHFQQAFKILELWGFPQAEKCYHLAYGFVTLPEGAMSARRGNVILFMDVYEEATRRAAAIIAEKNPDLAGEARQEVAEQIGLGALAYSMLSVDNNKDIVFNWDSALNFDGQTAPYIQNAHVRANSILRKAGGHPDAAVYDYEFDAAEIELIDLLSRFGSIVEKAAEDYKPLYLATYAYDLAKAFHLFYHAVRVIQAEVPSIRDARLRLTAATKQTLANTLDLLTIKAPDVM